MFGWWFDFGNILTRPIILAKESNYYVVVGRYICAGSQGLLFACKQNACCILGWGYKL